MKVGMIFECADEGPDYKVCAHYLAKLIRPGHCGSAGRARQQAKLA